MVELPGGSFLMGAAPDEHDAGVRQAYQDVGVDDGGIDEFLAGELPRHEVTVGGFRIMATPVTEGLYREIMGGDPPGPEANPEELPAVERSWEDALDFCNRLSERMGYRRCYRRRFGRWRCDWRADGYRLPTEGEWEYACRAGTSTRYCSGDDPRSVDSYGWHSGNSGRERKEVATRRPNFWGIYDMHGNVWEWCWDEFARYPEKASRDPRGPSGLWPLKRARRRVIRGGSFFFPPGNLRSAVRDFVDPVVRGDLLGFRCVRVPPQRSTP